MRCVLPGTIPGGGVGEPASYPAPPPGGAYGAGLSESDVRSLAEFARNLAVQHIIPNLEMRIRALNHQAGCLPRGMVGEVIYGVAGHLQAVGAEPAEQPQRATSVLVMMP